MIKGMGGDGKVLKQTYSRTHARTHSYHQAPFRPIQSHSAQSYSPLDEVHAAIPREKTTCPALLCMEVQFREPFATNHHLPLLRADRLTRSPPN